MQNWEYKKLGETYNFIDYRGMTPNKIDEGIPLITAKNVRMGYIDYSIKDFISEEDYKNRQTRGISHKGDILFTTEAPLGYSALADLEVFSTGQRIITFQQFDNEKNLFNPFFNYYFQSPEFQKLIKENATGLTATGIKASKLREILIPLPPLEEQKRIVKILDEKFAMLETVKANAKNNLQNAKDLFQSQLTKAFSNTTWEKKRLGENFFVKTGGTPSRSKNEYWDGDIAWYSSGELGNKYTTNSERTINELAIENSNAKLFPKGSLLIGMYDTAAMKMSLLDREGTFNQAIAGVKPNDENDLQFVRMYLESIKQEMMDLRRGTRQKNLSLEKISAIEIPLPPLPEQIRIVEQLDSLSEKVRSLEEIYTKQLANCDELKQSFLAKAFAGELTKSIKNLSFV